MRRIPGGSLVASLIAMSSVGVGVGCAGGRVPPSPHTLDVDVAAVHGLDLDALATRLADQPRFVAPLGVREGRGGLYLDVFVWGWSSELGTDFRGLADEVPHLAFRVFDARGATVTVLPSLYRPDLFAPSYISHRTVVSSGDSRGSPRAAILTASVRLPPAGPLPYRRVAPPSGPFRFELRSFWIDAGAGSRGRDPFIIVNDASALAERGVEPGSR